MTSLLLARCPRLARRCAFLACLAAWGGAFADPALAAGKRRGASQKGDRGLAAGGSAKAQDAAAAQDAVARIDRLLAPLNDASGWALPDDAPLHCGAVSLGAEQVAAAALAGLPKVRVLEQKLAAAVAKQLAARGAYDIKLFAKGDATPFGGYNWGAANLGAEQLTTLWGASVYGGYRIGQGDFQVYKGDKETNAAGELRAGVRVPLWQDRAIDEGRAGLRIAAAGVDVVKANVALGRIEIARKARQSWAKWVMTGVDLQIATALFELARAREVQVRGLVDAGAVPAIELLDNERIIAERADKVAESRRKLQQQTVAIALLLRDSAGVMMHPDLSCLPASLPDPHHVPELQPDHSMQRAFAHRPERVSLDAAIRQRQAELRLANNGIAPRLDIDVAGSRDVGEGKKKLEEAELLAMVRFEVPLQRRKARGRRDEVLAKLRALKAERGYVDDVIRAEVQSALAGLRAAEARIELAKAQLDRATKVAEAERARFELGQSSLLKVNLREQYAASARRKLLKARGDWWLARIDLAAVRAEVLPEPTPLASKTATR